MRRMERRMTMGRTMGGRRRVKTHFTAENQ
jgi:hypothetical protein